MSLQQPADKAVLLISGPAAPMEATVMKDKGSPPLDSKSNILDIQRGSASPPTSVAVISNPTPPSPTPVVNQTQSSFTVDIEPDDPAQAEQQDHPAPIDTQGQSNIDPAIRSSCPSPPDQRGFDHPLSSPFVNTATDPQQNATINPQSVQGPPSAGLQYPAEGGFQASWDKKSEGSDGSSVDKRSESRPRPMPIRTATAAAGIALGQPAYQPPILSASAHGLSKKPTESTEEHAARYRSEMKLAHVSGAVPSPVSAGRKGAGGMVSGHGIVMPGPQVKKKKSHARKQPADHIPRPRNRFMLFRKHVTDNKLIPPSVEIKHQNVSIIVAKMWAEAPAEVKAEFTEAAKLEKEEHARKYPNYRYQPAYRRTDIIRRRVRKDINEDEKCDAVASLLMEGKVGEKLETEIQGVIGKPEDTGAVTPVATRASKRGRKKDTPGELSKGAIRAQKAAVRAKALRENWADATRLAVSQGHHHHQLRSGPRVRYFPELNPQMRHVPEMHYQDQPQPMEVHYDPYPQYYEEDPQYDPYPPAQYGAVGQVDVQSEYAYAPQDQYGMAQPLQPYAGPAVQPLPPMEEQYQRYEPHSPHDVSMLTPVRMDHPSNPIYDHPPSLRGGPSGMYHVPELRSPMHGAFEAQPVPFHGQQEQYAASNVGVPMAWEAPQGSQPEHHVSGHRSYRSEAYDALPSATGYEHHRTSSQQYYPPIGIETSQPMEIGQPDVLPLESFTPAVEYAPQGHFLPGMRYAPDENLVRSSDVSARPRDIIAGQWMRESHQEHEKDSAPMEPLPPAGEHRNSIPFMERIEVAGPSQGIDFGGDGELFGGLLNGGEASSDMADYHQALRHQQEMEARTRVY